MYDRSKNLANQCITLRMSLRLVLFVFCHCKYTGDGKPVDNVFTSVPPAYLRKKEAVTHMDYHLMRYG